MRHPGVRQDCRVAWGCRPGPPTRGIGWTAGCGCAGMSDAWAWLYLGCILTVFCVTGMRTTTRRRHQARQNWLSSGRPQGPGAGTKGRLPAGLCPPWVSPSSLLPPRCHGRRESELCDLRGSGEKRSFLPFIPGLRAANPPFGAWNDFIIKPARSPSLFIYFFHPPNTWAMLGG